MHSSIILIVFFAILLIILMITCFICFIRSRRKEDEEFMQQVQFQAARQQQQAVAYQHQQQQQQQPGSKQQQQQQLVQSPSNQLSEQLMISNQDHQLVNSDNQHQHNHQSQHRANASSRSYQSSPQSQQHLGTTTTGSNQSRSPYFNGGLASNQVSPNTPLISPYHAAGVQASSQQQQRIPTETRSDMCQQINSAIIGSSEAEFQNDFIQVFPMYQIAPQPEKNTTPYLT